MIITYQNSSSFSFTEKDFSLLTDPWDLSGNPVIKTKEARVILSSLAEKAPAAIPVSPHFLRYPGEYEINNIIITGIDGGIDAQTGKRTTLYTLLINGVTIAYLGYANTLVSAAQLEVMGDANILMVPLGEEGTGGVSTAMKNISAIEPQVVIPARYSAQTLEEFKKEFGGKYITLAKYAVDRKNLPTEETELVILESK